MYSFLLAAAALLALATAATIAVQSSRTREPDDRHAVF